MHLGALVPVLPVSGRVVLPVQFVMPPPWLVLQPSFDSAQLPQPLGDNAK